MLQIWWALILSACLSLGLPSKNSKANQQIVTKIGHGKIQQVRRTRMCVTKLGHQVEK